MTHASIDCLGRRAGLAGFPRWNPHVLDLFFWNKGGTKIMFP
jgi:hypothetical protein